ncbi:hypothetical protein CIW82_10235 [Acetobacter tropicalis]|nr:hypothetical protein CIW82_10235 [Acetobacter tropicalis]
MYAEGLTFLGTKNSIFTFCSALNEWAGLEFYRMRNWLKTVLFLSAFSPALLSIAIARCWTGGLTVVVGFYVVLGILGSLLAMLVMRILRQKGEVINFTAKKIKSNDALMLGVVSTYFLPFIGKAADITPSIVLALLLLVAIILSLQSAIPPHPLLRLLRYRFYEVESASGVVYTLITRRDLHDPKQISAVRVISSSMLVEAT